VQSFRVKFIFRGYDCTGGRIFLDFCTGITTVVICSRKCACCLSTWQSKRVVFRTTVPPYDRSYLLFGRWAHKILSTWSTLSVLCRSL